MGVVFLIVSLNVLFYPSFSKGVFISLYFNASKYSYTDDYYAYFGESVTLTCIVPSNTEAYMYKGSVFSTYVSLVEDGHLVEDVNQLKDKYSFESNGRNNRLTIHDLDMKDSSAYRCGFCTSRWCTWPTGVYLEVKETTDNSQTPDFCELVDNTDGIFFTGNDLILRCPKLQFSLMASNESGLFDVDFEMDDDGDIFNILIVRKLKPTFSGTMISCLNGQNGDKSNDYCRSVPTILVFNNITIMISYEERTTNKGENVTFTCHSRPFVPHSMRWNLLVSDVTFDNFYVSDIDQGSRIAFSNVEFLNSFSSYLTVLCNVTIGLENHFKMASVYPSILQHVSTTDGTSPLSETLSLLETSPHITADTTISISNTDKRSTGPFFIIIPIIVATVVLGIIFVAVIYIKVRKPSTSSKGLKNTSTGQDYANRRENTYDTTKKEAELGLTHEGSAVVNNVAYVSYDDDYDSKVVDNAAYVSYDEKYEQI